MNVVTDFLASVAASPAVYAVLFLLCALDGFMAFLPSETALVAVTAIALSTGRPVLFFVLISAALGAIVGDNISYRIGRAVGTSRFAWMRRPRVADAFGRARRELWRRPASMIIIGRYVPVGRVVVNLTAGAAGLPYRKFLGLSVVAGLTWAIYSVLIGVCAAPLYNSQPVAALILAIAVPVVIGLAADKVMDKLLSKSTVRTA